MGSARISTAFLLKSLLAVAVAEAAAKLAGVTRVVTVTRPENASPLAASFILGSDTEGYVSTRIKMGKTASVIAVVKSGDKLFSTGKEVKVTIGGCGG